MNCLADSDYELLADRAGDIHIVHCPNCHEYFERPRFELERLLEIGVPVSLGTDSLASNKALNLFDEMRQLHRTHPAVSAKDAVEMITLKPARAIGLPGKLGEISKGALADLIAIPYGGAADDVYEAVRANREKIAWMLVNGQRT